METRELISVQLLCKRYNVPVSFINRLQEFQLVEIIIDRDDYYIHTTQIKEVEKMMRLHYDLDINIEGVDVIYNLLKQVESLKQDNISQSFGETETDGYQTLDIRLGVKPIKNVTLGVAVLNAFDEAYNNHLNFSFTNQADFGRVPITEPGRNLTAFLQYKF